MPDVTDYGPTIADLERKRDEIDRTIAMLRAFSGLPAGEPTMRNDTRSGADHAEVEQLFLEASTKDAAYAKGHGLIHDIRDVQIPPGCPFVQLVF